MLYFHGKAMWYLVMPSTDDIMEKWELFEKGNALVPVAKGLVMGFSQL